MSRFTNLAEKLAFLQQPALSQARECMQKHSDGVDDVIRALEAEETRIIEEIEDNKRQGSRLKAELKRVQLSLAALTGTSASKASLQDADALQLVAKALIDGPRSASELGNQLLAHAKASGLSGTGVHLVLARVLKNPRFQETQEGYRLSS